MKERWNKSKASQSNRTKFNFSVSLAACFIEMFYFSDVKICCMFCVLK